MHWRKILGLMILSLPVFLISPYPAKGAGSERKENAHPAELSRQEGQTVTETETDISIDISYPPQNDLIIPYKEIFLEGKILAKAGIKKIELNGKNVFHINDIKMPVEKCMNNAETITGEKKPDPNKKIIRDSRTSFTMNQVLHDALQNYTLYHLNQILSAKEERIILDLLVEDNSGNTASKHLTITKISSDNQLNRYNSHRMTLALVPLIEEGGYEIDIQGYIFHRLLESFTRQGRFNLVEREKLPWLLIEKAIKTKNFNKNNVRRDIAYHIGQVTQAEGIVFAELHRIDNGIEIAGRYMAMKTKDALLFHRVFSPVPGLKSNKDFEDLNTIISGLAIKFRDSFPLCTGTIMDKKGRIVHVNLGANQGVFPGMGYNIYRNKDGRDVISKAIIKEVSEGSSTAWVVDEDKSGEIKEGYQVNTR